MWLYWLVYLLLLPLAPFVIAAVVGSASLQMSKPRWIADSLALLLIVLTLPIYVWLGFILDPSISDKVWIDDHVEWEGFAAAVGTLFYIFTGSATLIGYAIFAWYTRRRRRVLVRAS